MITTTDDRLQPLLTADGSHTLLHPILKEYYHSLQGSLQESIHIFINLGLKPLLETASEGTAIRIFEMGFGSGLNALLSWKLADELQKKVEYTGIEAYPITLEASKLLNYEQLTGKEGLSTLHNTPWGEARTLSPYFTFQKIECFFEDYRGEGRYHVIFFDAFAPEAQPELWTSEIFHRLGNRMIEGGYLVTYSSKGSVRRALKEAGFTVEKHPGPGRKREVVRAIWPHSG